MNNGTTRAEILSFDFEISYECDHNFFYKIFENFEFNQRFTKLIKSFSKGQG